MELAKKQSGAVAVGVTPRNVPPPEDIATRLRQLRDDAGQGQEEFAARWRIPARTYQTYERGESWLSCAFLRELAKAGINVNWLLTGVGEMRGEQQLRLGKIPGKGDSAGTVDQRGDFKPLSVGSDGELERVHQETAAIWRRLTRPGVIAEIAGIDGDLAHRLADISLLNADRAGRGDDTIGPMVSLVIMLDEAYRAAELVIASVDVGRIAADEYRAIYEAGESSDERRAASKAVQVRHMRAAAWAKNMLLKGNHAGGPK